MDFDLDEDQRALGELAARILLEQATTERLKQIEADAANGGDGMDHKLWGDLAGAGIVAAPLSDESGGAGLGLLGAGAVLEEVGRRVAPVPYLEAVLGGLVIERFGADEPRRSYLPKIADGSLIVAAALTEVQGNLAEPSTTARLDEASGEWVIDGEKVCVPGGLAAGGFLVAATLADGSTCVAVVDSDAAGLERERQDTTFSRPEALIRLTGVRVPASAILGT